MVIKDYIKFVRSYEFMSNINRNKNRQNLTQEYFTCLELVNEILDRVNLQIRLLF